MTAGGAFHLGSLKPASGSSRRGRYLGRGRSSGHGKTSGRGIKGQMSRTGADRRPGFSGGNIPQMMRTPKRGFVSPFKVDYREVNINRLAAAFTAGEEAGPEAMREKGLVSSVRPGVKILGSGEITVALKVSAHGFSGEARRKIEAAGGTCTVIEGRGGR
jgi:large subunit ribosomal protein L15